MVLELLVNPKRFKGNAWEMFFIGAVYSFVSVFLSMWIFKTYTSIVMITLTVIASVPFIHNAIKEEELKNVNKKKVVLSEHKKIIMMFLYLFLGYVASFVVLYTSLSPETVQNVFSAQIETIVTITPTVVSGNFWNTLPALSAIFFNNMKILLFCIIFSFFYGAGAIFILTWNASVMATAIGSFLRKGLLGATNITAYFHLTTIGLLQYLLHGIPEILAYFIGGLASGMISFALIRHDYKEMKGVLLDASNLILIAGGILIVAALLEVYVTPVIVLQMG